ncbi:MAG: hypothetical protein N2109_13615, partial [Fimbriimonadales bacterium]|nr:hypothetical protein [Fimbriimonadales bacterium]
WKVAQKETALRIRMVATPTGGGGGVGGYADTNPAGGTYTLNVENLAPNTEYDVVIYLEYLDPDVKQKAVFSQTYKVKTK